MTNTTPLSALSGPAQLLRGICLLSQGEFTLSGGPAAARRSEGTSRHGEGVLPDLPPPLCPGLPPLDSPIAQRFRARSASPRRERCSFLSTQGLDRASGISSAAATSWRKNRATCYRCSATSRHRRLFAKIAPTARMPWTERNGMAILLRCLAPNLQHLASFAFFVPSQDFRSASLKRGAGNLFAKHVFFFFSFFFSVLRRLKNPPPPLLPKSLFSFRGFGGV